MSSLEEVFTQPSRAECFSYHTRPFWFILPVAFRPTVSRLRLQLAFPCRPSTLFQGISHAAIVFSFTLAFHYKPVRTALEGETIQPMRCPKLREKRNETILITYIREKKRKFRLCVRLRSDESRSGSRFCPSSIGIRCARTINIYCTS